METFKIKIEQCKKMGGELEDTMSTTYLTAMIQDLGEHCGIHHRGSFGHGQAIPTD